MGIHVGGRGGKVTEGGAHPAHNTTECLKSSGEFVEKVARKEWHSRCNWQRGRSPGRCLSECDELSVFPVVQVSGFRVPSLGRGLTGPLMAFVHGQMVGGPWSSDRRQ